jgi:hypothetical protein
MIESFQRTTKLGEKMFDLEKIFKDFCDMSFEEREELLKMIVNREPDLADGVICSLGAKYQQFRIARGDE